MPDYTSSIEYISKNPYEEIYKQFPEYYTKKRTDIGIYGNHYYPGRYYSRRDLGFFGTINAEFVGIITECVVQLFKIAVSKTDTNVYGESETGNGKVYYNPVDMTALIQREDISADNTEGFGVDRNQSVVFKFRERDCIVKNFFPEIGDLVFYNDRFYEMDNVIQEQLLGGHPSKSWSFICNTHYTRLSKINTVERQN